jgi:hypothetical protein
MGHLLYPVGQEGGMRSYPIPSPVKTLIWTFWDMYATGGKIQVEIPVSPGPSILRASAIVQGGAFAHPVQLSDISFGGMQTNVIYLNLEETDSGSPYSGMIVVEYVEAQILLEPSDVPVDHE